MDFPASKILTMDQAVAQIAKWHADGLKFTLTNGCFDILHRGHAEYLYSARQQADKLVVLMNSDESVRRLKGPSRPVNCEYDRAFILGSLEFVDAVIIFSSPRCTKEIETLAPDVYVKGADYTVDTLDPEERAALFKVHADIRFIEFVPGHSTTLTIQKMREPEKK